MLTTLFYVVAVFLVVSWFFGDKDSRTNKELSYTKFTAYVESNMVEKLVVYDDNSAKATIRPMHYAIVFGDQDSGEAAKGLIKTQVPSTEEVSKYMDSVNAARKEKGLDLREVQRLLVSHPRQCAAVLVHHSVLRVDEPRHKRRGWHRRHLRRGQSPGTGL